MSSTDIYKVNARELREHIEDCLQGGTVPFVKSSPGVGKSSIFKQVARDFGLKMIDHRLSTSRPEDLTGYPRLDKKAKFVPFDLFPIQGMDEPEEKYPEGWLLFLDEFNSAPKDVQAAAYKVMLDRQVGQYDLHEDCYLGSAGNLTTDRAITNNLSTAMQSRIIHFSLECDFQIWQEDVALKQKYDPRIIAYLAANPSKLMDFRPDHTDDTFCCPRTWEFMNRHLAVRPEVTDKRLPLFVGTISSGVAAEFVAFCKVEHQLPKLKEILADPEGARLPTDSPSRYMTQATLAHYADTKNFGSIMKYIDRLPADFRVLFFRSIRVQKPALKSHPEYRKGLITISRYLNDDDKEAMNRG